MSLRDWLPITTRNRVALSLAALSLVLLVIWNCLPTYQYHGASKPNSIGAVVWLEVFSSEIYMEVLKGPNFDDFLNVATSLAFIQNALATLAIVPFWKVLHASSYIRLPLAVVNMLGGFILLWHLRELGESPWFVILLLISLGMFALSASLFLFKNELALREEKMVRELTGKGGTV